MYGALIPGAGKESGWIVVFNCALSFSLFGLTFTANTCSELHDRNFVGFYRVDYSLKTWLL